MSELTPEAKRLLAQLRDVDDPTSDERNTGDAAVRRMLATHGMQNLPPLRPASAPQISAKPPLGAARSGAAVKLAWVLGTAFVATLGIVGIGAWRASSPAATLPAREPASSTQPASAAPQPQAAADVPAEPLPASPAATPHRRREPAQSSLAMELRFVSSVDAEIRAGAYDRALRRLNQHQGSAVLQEERTAMRVLALCGREQNSQALREREHFLKAFPSSVLGARVRAACAGAPSP
jgi:hypothetical protein